MCLAAPSPGRLRFLLHTHGRGTLVPLANLVAGCALLRPPQGTGALLTEIRAVFQVCRLGHLFAA